MKRRKLNRREAHRLALHSAIVNEDSLADAYHSGTPEREEALWMAQEFRRVLAEEFGERCFQDALSGIRARSVSVHELKGGNREFAAPKVDLRIPKDRP